MTIHTKRILKVLQKHGFDFLFFKTKNLFTAIAAEVFFQWIKRESTTTCQVIFTDNLVLGDPV